MDATIKPDQFLIIIGSAKCGTTSLFDYLGQHPAVCTSVPKEPAYFTEHQKKDHPKHWRHISRYEDFWPDFDPVVHRYALEGSTGYTWWPVENGVAQRMRAYGIRPRLIYLVRDPIERIESDVNRRRTVNRRRVSFEDSFFVDVSRFATQIDPYVETYGREAIRVVDFAQLCADPNQVCAELYDWLDLEPHSIADTGISNETASLKRSQLDRVVANNRTLQRAARIFPPVVRQQAKKVALKRVPYRHQRVRVSPDRAREIRELLQEDVDRLAREWGVDVAPWGRQGRLTGM